MRNHRSRSQLGLIIATTTWLAGCAPGLVTRADRSSAAVVVDIKNDHRSRPGSVRLAAADYVLDGVSVLSMRPNAGYGSNRGDVADHGSWAGAVSPGEHVLEATLSYPPRNGDESDLAFSVHKKFNFRSGHGGLVRIQVAESVEDTGLTASLDQRLDVRFVKY